MGFHGFFSRISPPLCLLLALSATAACGEDPSSSTGGTGGASTGGSSTGGASTGGSSTGGSSTGGASTGGGGTEPGTGGAGGLGGSGGAGGGSQAVLPKIGAHGLSFYFLDQSSLPSIDSPPLATKTSGSTIVVSAGRGTLSAAALPTDNKGNQPYKQLGQAHPYTKWQTSGTALYAFEGAAGGLGHIVTSPNEPYDEITLAVVEVTSASHVQDFQWIERQSGQPLTSAPVTTTGPATLVAFWWGDGGADGDKVAVPNNGFQVLDSAGQSGPLVQCFVAAKEVDAAGTYDVTWDATPTQGAQLWLVAVP